MTRDDPRITNLDFVESVVAKIKHEGAFHPTRKERAAARLLEVPDRSLWSLPSTTDRYRLFFALGYGVDPARFVYETGIPANGKTLSDITRHGLHERVTINVGARLSEPFARVLTSGHAALYEAPAYVWLQKDRILSGTTSGYLGRGPDISGGPPEEE